MTCQEEQPDEVDYTGPLIVDHIDKVPGNTSGGRRGGTRGRASGSLKQKYLHDGDIEEILVYNVAYSKSTVHITESDHDAIYFVSPVLYTALLRLSPYQLAPCELGPLYRSEYVYIFITIHCCACFERSTTCCKLSRKLWTWF